MKIEQLIVFVKYSKFPRQVKEAIIVLLEKQISKKVVNQHKLFDIYDEGTCPSCGNRLFHKVPYCSECGQKLEWSEY